MASIFSLEGRVALVTGSSQGIGLAVAKGVAEHGAHVVLNGRSEERLRQAALSVPEAATSCFDVTDPSAIEAGVATIEKDIGPIDILINNAAMQFRTPLEDFPLDMWRQLLETNVSSALYVGQSVARHMIPRGRGKIVNVASVQSELARQGIAPYTATKGAIKNLTRGMCTDWAQYGLQVNAIAPGYFKTPLTKHLLTIQSSRPGWKSERRRGAGVMLRNSLVRPSFSRRMRPPS